MMLGSESGEPIDASDLNLMASPDSSSAIHRTFLTNESHVRWPARGSEAGFPEREFAGKGDA